MGETDYLLFLTSEDRMRVFFLTERGKVVSFRVQYEAFILGAWRPIIRYDTAYRFPHIDVIHADGTQEKQPLFLTYGEGLTYALNDIITNWKQHRKRYEGEMSR